MLKVSKREEKKHKNNILVPLSPLTVKMDAALLITQPFTESEGEASLVASFSPIFFFSLTVPYIPNRLIEKPQTGYFHSVVLSEKLTIVNYLSVACQDN